MIDIGPCNNQLYYEGEFTPQYYRQPQRKFREEKDHQGKTILKRLVFEKDEERYSSELFCLYRCMNILMLLTAS